MSETPTQSSAEAPRRRLGWVVVPVLIFGALALMFGLALTSGDPSKLPSALIGKPVPPTSFAALEGLNKDGTPVSGFTSDELGGGQVRVVNFWASWCGPCVAEHPLLVELAARTGVPLYGVNYKDQPEAARRFLGRYGNPFTAVGADPLGRGAIDWGVYGMPETFVIGADGTIAYKHVGPISEQSLRDQLIPAIESARKQAALASG